MKRAQKVLAQYGLIDISTLSGCRKIVKKAILQSCPHFELLASVTTTSISQKEREWPKDTTQHAVEARESPLARRKRARVIEIDQENQSALPNPTTRIKAEPEPTVNPSDVSAPGLKTLDQLEMEIQEARFRLEREKRKLELDATQRRIQLEFRAAQEKQESALVVERALTRRKLLDAGISIEEVDLLLPSKRVRR